MVADGVSGEERKRGRPTADERTERRAQILDAALAVFLEFGFGNTTIDQLAVAARVTKRTIYSYFGDKDGVFTEMVRILATSVSSDISNSDTLESVTTRIVFRLDSAELIGLHRLVIAESTRFPELAVALHDNGEVQHIARLAEHIRRERGAVQALLAPQLFTLLVGEEHRKRLLGLQGAVTAAEAREHALATLATLGLADAGIPLPAD